MLGRQGPAADGGAVDADGPTTSAKNLILTGATGASEAYRSTGCEI